MEKLLLGIGVVCLIAVIFLVAPLLGAAFGSLAGFVVGWTFDETSAKVMAFAGLSEFAMWEVGATLGFLGGFIKSSLTSNSE